MEHSSSLQSIPIPDLHDCGKELYFTIDRILDIVILISKSAVKNKELGFTFGNNFNSIFTSITHPLTPSDHEKCFKIFHKFALFKQFAQNVWHGSVIGSIIDGNFDLKNFIELGRKISESVVTKQQSDEVWEPFSKQLNAQNDAHLNELLASRKPGQQLSQSEVASITKHYDTSEDYFEDDLRNFDKIGYNNAFYQNVYKFIKEEPVPFHLNSEILLCNNHYEFAEIGDAFPDVATIKMGQTIVNPFRELWLCLFRNKISIPIDEFTYQISFFCQLLHKDEGLNEFFKDKVVQELKEFAQSSDYYVDLRRDGSFFKRIVHMIASKTSGAKVEETITAESTIANKGAGSRSISIQAKGYDLELVRSSIKEIKKGNGRDIKLAIKQESNTIDPTIQPLGLVGQVLNGPSNQGLITLGNSLENDIYLPKTGLIFGTQFGLIFKDGNLHVIDFSSSVSSTNTLLRFNKNEKIALKQGQVLNFANTVDYHISSLTSGHIKLDFVRDTKTGNSKDKKSPEGFDLEIPSTGIIVSRNKGQVMTIPKLACSANHCKIFGDGIVDTSSNGTFVYLKTFAEQQKQIQSQLVKLDQAKNNIQVIDIDFEVL
ncbi:UNKNOWN [Stylonychia lemnae]|uniref:Uncharacterized protein n=1 Tax=Stylonychia lemnae TaxID=5949 RepID=A0A078AZH8_STYLE|nr:UNKNOWN [Stylonychia lemnae]|eukprot:CDW86607.1 UNKNOWN [Stylonychia lemnae]